MLASAYAEFTRRRFSHAATPIQYAAISLRFRCRCFTYACLCHTAFDTRCHVYAFADAIISPADFAATAPCCRFRRFSHAADVSRHTSDFLLALLPLFYADDLTISILLASFDVISCHVATLLMRALCARVPLFYAASATPALPFYVAAITLRFTLCFSLLIESLILRAYAAMPRHAFAIAYAICRCRYDMFSCAI